MRPRRPVGSDGENTSAYVTSLVRGLDILSAFRRGEASLGNKELATRTGLSKSTVSRLTYTLHKAGYMSYDPTTSRYSLAPPVLSLGYTCLSGMNVLTLSKPKMEAFAKRYGAAVAVAGRDRLSMVYLECALGSSPITMAIAVGVHIKLATSAVGRAYIAAQPEHERAKLFEALEEHEGKRWPKIRDELLEAVESYQQTGFCLSLRSWKPDVHAVAVPYIPGDGSPILAFNCGGPTQTLPVRKLNEEIGPELVRLVAEINQITR